MHTVQTRAQSRHETVFVSSLSCCEALLSPVVQNGELVRYRHASGQQLGDRRNDSALVEVPLWVIIFADHKDSGMVPAHGDDQILQIPEIIMVMGKTNAIFMDRMSEMHGIVLARHAGIRGDLDIVT